MYFVVLMFIMPYREVLTHELVNRSYWAVPFSGALQSGSADESRNILALRDGDNFEVKFALFPLQKKAV